MEAVIVGLMFVISFGILGVALSYGAILIFRGLGNRPVRHATSARTSAPVARRANSVGANYRG
ncbi:hypothetical protein [Thiomonas sp.]